MVDIEGILYGEMSKKYRCTSEEIASDENIFVLGNKHEPMVEVLCINGKLVVKAGEELLPWCKEKYKDIDGAWFTDFGYLRSLDNKLQELGHYIADIHHYYIPGKDSVVPDGSYELKWFNKEEILGFKDDERFDEAFAFNEGTPDVLAVAAMEKGEILGMAGASMDYKNLWQVGINVIPEAQGKGIGTYLVTNLKNELLNRGVVPFYGTMGSHARSQRIAIKAGFMPTWTAIYSERK